MFTVEGAIAPPQVDLSNPITHIKPTDPTASREQPVVQPEKLSDQAPTHQRQRT